MPSADEHLGLADRTHGTLEVLIKAGSAHSPWVATLAFYKAVHLVEAYLAGAKIHSTSHEDREYTMQRDRRLSHVLSQYRSLKTQSMVARYMDGNLPFEKVMPGDMVLGELIHHRLHQLEESILKLLPKKSHMRRAQSLPRSFVVESPVSGATQARVAGEEPS